MGAPNALEPLYVLRIPAGAEVGADEGGDDADYRAEGDLRHCTEASPLDRTVGPSVGPT